MKIANKNRETLVSASGRSNYVINKKAGLRNRIMSNKAKRKEDACNFSFTIFLSSSDDHWYLSWYIDKDQDTLCSSCHTNHFPINPSDLCISNRSHLSKECHKSIEELILNGVPIPTIIKVINLRFKVTIESSVVRNMRTQIINDMSFLEDEHNTNTGTAATKLINMLSLTENISFIYLKHHKTSGFVTYTKAERKEVKLDKESTMTLESWRKQLLLEDDEILVSCAWIHDDERRLVHMYPEFLCFDTTFGLNRQRRSLFLAVGTDGDNNVFPAFRCWMPSKQRAAFFWTITQAIPHLFGNDLCGQHKVISSDSEASLVEAIKGAINTPNSHFSNAKFRTDYFHFFELKWKGLVGACSSSNSGGKQFESHTKTVKLWIKTWFNAIHSEEELKMSHRDLLSFLETEKMELGEMFCLGIRNIITSIMCAKKDLIHYEFKNKTSFGFLGSSIVEAMNSSIKKKGLHSIESTMTISHSTLCQLKQTENRTQIKFQQVANSLNRNHRYLQTDLDQHLCHYCLDNGAKKFDHRLLYYVRQKEDLQYWVMKKGIHDNKGSPKAKFPVTKFDRVHLVTINGQFITCTCGYVNQYLSPCEHVMAVLSEKENVKFTLFHYRWWKQFYYFSLRDFNEGSIMHNENIASITDKFRPVVKFVRENAFNNNGEYKGCYLDDDILLKLKYSHIEDDEVYERMDKLAKYWKHIGPVRTNSNVYMQDTAFIRTKDTSTDNSLLPMDGGMTMVVQLSQQDFGSTNDPMEDYLSESGSSDFDFTPTRSRTEKGTDVWNSTMEAHEQIMTYQDEEAFIQLMVDFTNQRKAMRSEGRVFDASIYGSELSNFCKAGKRRRYFWEGHK